MPGLVFSIHAREMLVERQIPEEWVWRALDAPDIEETGVDQNRHYMKAILEFGGRVLHVVVNPHTQPARIVTVFFDRRFRRQQ